MRLAIIGAGHAGGRLAAALVEHQFAGQITLIGDENFSPYERPSLSKRNLIAPDGKFGSPILKDSHMSDRSLSLVLGTTVQDADLASQVINLDDGSAIQYDRCVFATGVRPRKLELPETLLHGDRYYLRTADDSRLLSSRLHKGGRVLIIGAGFIGLEVASSACALGCEVTVIEQAPLLIPRILSMPASSFLQTTIEANGMKLMLATALNSINTCDQGGYIGHLSCGTSVNFDFAVIGIGSLPNEELAAAAGLTCDNGIVVNQEFETSATGVYAIGDVARVNDLSGGKRRESWDNVQRQALSLARNLCDLTAEIDQAPDWFWSDLGDTNLQVIGEFSKHTQCIERIVDRNRRTFFHCRNNKIVAAELFNMGGDRRPIEKLISDGITVEPALLRNPDIRVRSLLS